MVESSAASIRVALYRVDAHPRLAPLNRVDPEYKCYLKKQNLLRCQIGASAGWQVFGWALITTE